LTDRSSARDRIRQLARESIARGDLTGWFEQIYADAHGDTSGISWADLEPNPHLKEWVTPRADDLRGKRALVVGCGLGDDAEALRALGMQVTAFDISPTAVQWCKRRFPDSTVEYLQADAAAPPTAWTGRFDLVVEIYTLQVLVPELRRQAAESIARCAAREGQLFIVCRGREPSEAEGEFPWPLTKAELDAFTRMGLREESFEDFMDGDTRRFRAVYRRV
jgi:SAM-dependent methyltransferase